MSTRDDLIAFAVLDLPALIVFAGMAWGCVVLSDCLNVVARPPVSWRTKLGLGIGGLYVAGCAVLDSLALAPAATEAVLTAVGVLTLGGAAIVVPYGALLMVAAVMAWCCRCLGAVLSRAPGMPVVVRAIRRAAPILGRVLLILLQVAFIVAQIALAVLAIGTLAAAARERGRGPRPYFGVFVRNGHVRPCGGFDIPTSLGAVGIGRRGAWAAFRPRRPRNIR